MGYNCVAVLLNDFSYKMRDSGGHLGKEIAIAMSSWYPDRPEYGDFRGGQVISRDHADGYQITVVHGNTGCLIKDAKNLPIWSQEELADCLKRYGWTVKPPKKKKRGA